MQIRVCKSVPWNSFELNDSSKLNDLGVPLLIDGFFYILKDTLFGFFISAELRRPKLDKQAANGNGCHSRGL